MNPQLQIMLSQAIQAFETGNFERAESIIKKILKVDPKNYSALSIFGLIRVTQTNYKEASDYLKRATSIQPNDAAIQYNLAKSLHDLGNLWDSIPHHKKAVELAPKNPRAWLSYGKTLLDLSQYLQALDCFDEALKLTPDYVEALINKGIALHQIQRYAEAITHFDIAISLKPDFAEIWSNKGNTLYEIKQYDEAIEHFTNALSLKPDFAEGWSNKGNALYETKRYDEAITNHDKALSLKPNYAEGWYNKGVTLNALKRYDEVISCFDKALTLKNDIEWVFGDLLHTKMKICDWSHFNDDFDELSNSVMTNKRVLRPFPALGFSDNTLFHKKAAEIYTLSKYPHNDILGLNHKYSQKEKIRVGYFSGDFREHPVAFLTAELFELHDKNRFEIVAFSFGVDSQTLLRSRLEQAFDLFIDVKTKSDQQIAQLSRHLEIDIAVDLGGHTDSARVGIFACRAAPIQLSYIGYLGTIGAEYYDYLVADKTIIPSGFDHFYAEKIVRLPNYQANDRKRAISDKKFTRTGFGLPSAGIIFCCFNNNYKFLPATFDSWMHILKAVDGSILFLYADSKWSKANLIKEARVRGVDCSRLVFGEHISYSEYLTRYQVCDLFLDTFPYNAGTTASDALWTGLPVLTLMGQSFASRVAASLLNAIDLPELITTNQEQYEALAIELATNPQKLAKIKLKLANNRLTTPLFDTPLFTKNLEAAYIQMYDRYQAGLEPDHISII
jgi:predicted O-linked N-acetylglucosamine transferase (SPINDLY family)